MKKQVTQKLLILALIIAAIACKSEKKSENTVKETTQQALTYNGTKTFDITKSSIIWKGYKLFGNHTGDIMLKNGELVFDNGELTGGSFVADMNSIRATELMKDDDEEEEEEEEGEDDKSDLANHLKDGDFFNAKTYPTAKFTITNVTKQENGYTIKGNMTIKNKTNEIEFPAQIQSDHFNATVKIDRTKFGIKYGSGSFFDNLGDNVIKDEFDLEISLRIK